MSEFNDPFVIVRQMVQQGAEDGTYPSAAVAVGVGGQTLVREAYGAARPETLFDMASMSKVLATTMIAFQMIEAGKLCLTDSVGSFFQAPPDKSDITVFQLMTHTSGIPAHFHLADLTDDPSRAADVILAQPLAACPGQMTVYSCMGYILLGKILEQIGGRPLDQLAESLVFGPLGMKRTTYHPKAGDDIAPTERNRETGQYLRGIVHDENARFLNGISANAGVFSTLDDIALFARMLASGGRLPNGTPYLSTAMFALAAANHTPGMTENRGLGFKLAGGEGNFMGDLFPARSIGHTGFTGTSLVVDPGSGLYVVLLTNRVHPTRDNIGIIRFRKLLHNAVYAAFSRSLAQSAWRYD
ncbi:MAG: serine hydrolase domain-containing protein [Clostridiaceae bacterium]|nr:serine hydrolase domain-containing protein [Clostridiaceae bacterium]